MQQLLGVGFFIVAFWVYKEYNALLLSGFFFGIGLFCLDLFKWIIRNFILTVIITIVLCIMAILSFPGDSNITTCSGIMLVGCVLVVIIDKASKK
jgi:ABC-type uncharacterized transport system permease subunit